VFLAMTAVAVHRLLFDNRPTTWMTALCGLFAILSLTATLAVREHYTGGLNVAEPLIGLGAFGGGMSRGLWPRLAGAALIAVHRGALVLAGTGFTSEHAILAVIECGSFTAAIVGSTLVRAVARRLDDEAEALQRDAIVDAAKVSEFQAIRERKRMVHDAPLRRLEMVGQDEAVDSAEFRRACARDAELLRGHVDQSEPTWNLAEILDDLIPDYERRGLHVRLDKGDDAAYPKDVGVVRALVGALHQCLVNVYLHSGQNEADVTVTAVSDRISILVEDHGRGFIPTDHAGLGSGRSIGQRMRDIGGDAHTESEVKKGTTVTLVWPRIARSETVRADDSRRLGKWLRSNRWSRQQARKRCENLSTFMWNSLPFGLAVFIVVNIVQLVAGWPAYRHGWVAVLLLLVLASAFLLVWRRSPNGVGLGVSSLALVAGPAACLTIATQLNQTGLTGLANWVSGFCIVPIILLPFSRPIEEMVLGLAALIGAQAFVMADAGRSLRDLHTIVMSGGAGPVIGIGTFFLVAVIRRMDAVNQELKRQGLDAIWSRVLQDGTGVSLQLRVNATEARAAEMLEALAEGAVNTADPGVQGSCATVAADLRRELQDLEEQSLLLAEILPDGGELRWVITDKFNLSQRFRSEDRILLARALRGILRILPEGISITVRPISDNHAQVMMISESSELPDLPDWRAFCQAFGVVSTPGSAQGERWIYRWDMPVKIF